MPIHIIVCIKSVVRSAPRGVAQRTPDNSELNPFDRPALEAALQIKAAADGRLSVLSMGPAVCLEALAEARAMGADRAVLVSDRALAGSDTLVTSRVLAAAISRLAPFDLVLFGTRTSDSDTGQVGPQTASLLNLPFVSGVKKIQTDGTQWEIERIMDDWQERWQVQSPAAMTIHPRAFPSRPVALSGIARVFEQPDMDTWKLADIALHPDNVGLAGSPTRVAALQGIRRSRKGEMLDGQPQEQVEALIARLIDKGVMEL